MAFIELTFHVGTLNPKVCGHEKAAKFCNQLFLGPFDATALNGHDLVVYEELYKQSSIDGKSTDILVAQHKDLNDKDQTVTVTSTPKGGFYGKTGGNDAGFQLAIVLLIAAAVGLGLYGLKCRRAAKQEEADSDSAKNEDSGSEDGTSES